MAHAMPNLWLDGTTGSTVVDPAACYADIIGGIRSRPGPETGAKATGWTADAVTYNLFVRLAAAFDHDSDGMIGTEPLASGFRETGTLLKAIAMLPYLERLGVNTVYLLPITTIGEQNRKGVLGSPYAVRNPRAIDPMLGEPALGLSLDTQFAAFIEAAHHLGMRVVQEFVFRTASVDSDWVRHHPDWFYWLRNDDDTPYGPPSFSREMLAEIYEKVDKHDLHDLPAPDEAYRNRFVTPATVEVNGGAPLGRTAEGVDCRIASAFSDWPPDDRQPPWTDVAYLKMHRDPEFDYIAYNTIRMYDDRLNRHEVENRSLWEEIAGIIPWYQERFGIDGAMIDMGHALPTGLKAAIVAGARRNRPDFAFWDENFDPSPKIKEEGFDAVFGSLPFVIHDVQYIKGLLNFLNRNGVAVPFFATGENHNTPRVCHHLPRQESGRRRTLFLFTLGAVLPAMPFIHSGMELCEWHPVNLGLNFTDEDRNRFPAESLPLFGPGAYDWNGANGLEPLWSDIRKILGIRSRHLELIRCGDTGSIIQPYVSDPAILTVMRKSGGKSLIFAGNSNFDTRVSGIMEFEPESMELVELIGGSRLQVRNHRLEFDFDPGQCILFELPSQS
jgi:hypothetical protein